MRAPASLLAALLAAGSAPAGALGPERPLHSNPPRRGKIPRGKAAAPALEREKPASPPVQLWVEPEAPETPDGEAPPAEPARTPAEKKPPAPTGEVLRGELRVLVRAQGTVRAEELFRLKSTIEGRVEQVFARPTQWFAAGKPLVKVLPKEYAAIMDAKVTTPQAVMEDRWEPVYQASPATCEGECFVLKVFAVPKRWVQPEALLIEAARTLRLFGRVRPGDSQWVSDGQILTYWPKAEPKRRQQVRVERFILDTQGERLEPAGSFTARLDSKRYLDPGTEWEGKIEIDAKRKALRVPTSALIRYEGETFLTIRVSTGITTHDFTEVTAGVSDRDKFLILDEAQRGKIEAHEPPPAFLEAGEDPARPRRHNARTRELPPEPQRRRRRKMWDPPKIDVFPGDEQPKDDADEDKFPSDL